MAHLVSGIGFGEMAAGERPQEVPRVDVLAGSPAIGSEEASIVTDLQAGSEDAYSWLVAHYHGPIYGLLYRMLRDPADASDVTQEVFLKVVRGIRNFKGDSTLKTWLYRIAIHEASNQRRWWVRHKRQETSIEPTVAGNAKYSEDAGGDRGRSEAWLVDRGDSPLQNLMHEEVRANVEAALAKVAEPYRTVVILRDIEACSYEEVAHIVQVSLGTVKSRLARGRQAMRKYLQSYVDEGM